MIIKNTLGNLKYWIKYDNPNWYSGCYVRSDASCVSMMRATYKNSNNKDNAGKEGCLAVNVCFLDWVNIER